MMDILKQKIDTFRSIFEAIPSGILVINKERKIEFFNRFIVTTFFEKMTIKKLERIIKNSSNISDIFNFITPSGEILNLLDAINTTKKNGETFDQIILENIITSQKYKIILTVAPIYNDTHDEIIGGFLYFSNMSDYYDIHDKYDITKEEATKDGLTTLFNKNYLIEYVNDEIAKSLKTQKYEFSIVMIDIDHFKNVNDTYGHLIGDEILKILSKKMQENIRHNDIAARFGGEEFVLVLGYTNLKNSILVAERLRKSMEQEDFSGYGIPHPITISIGIYNVNEKNVDMSTDFDFVIEKADKALYYSKEHSRNMISIYYKDKIYSQKDFFDSFL